MNGQGNNREVSLKKKKLIVFTEATMAVFVCACAVLFFFCFSVLSGGVLRKEHSARVYVLIGQLPHNNCFGKKKKKKRREAKKKTIAGFLNIWGVIKKKKY